MKKLIPLLIIGVLLFSSITYAQEIQQEQGFFDKLIDFFINLFEEDTKEETILNQLSEEQLKKEIHYVPVDYPWSISFEFNLDATSIIPSKKFVHTTAKSLIISQDGRLVDRQVQEMLIPLKGTKKIEFEYILKEEGIYDGLIVIKTIKGECFHLDPEPYEMVLVVLPQENFDIEPTVEEEPVETTEENEIINKEEDENTQKEPKYITTSSGTSVSETIPTTPEIPDIPEEPQDDGDSNVDGNIDINDPTDYQELPEQETEEPTGYVITEIDQEVSDDEDVELEETQKIGISAIVVEEESSDHSDEPCPEHMEEQESLTVNYGESQDIQETSEEEYINTEFEEGNEEIL